MFVVCVFNKLIIDETIHNSLWLVYLVVAWKNNSQLKYELTLCRRMWNGAHDFFDLINGRRPGEERLAQEHLSQNATYAPHVHTFCVPAGNIGPIIIIYYILWLIHYKMFKTIYFGGHAPTGSQENFRGSVPSCCHILCQGRIHRILLDLVQGSCQAKVTQLHKAIWV